MLTQTQTPTKRILILGAECTGKTTLAQALAEHFDTAWVGEYMREYLNHKPNGYICQYDDLIPIAQGQMLLENQYAHQAHNYLFCDTSLLLLKVYSDWYFNQCPDRIKSAIAHLHYDWVFVTDDLGVDWVADGQRDLPHGRKQIREKIIHELNHYQIAYHSISGNLTKRLNQVIKILSNK